MKVPPGDSLRSDQAGRVAAAGADAVSGLENLLHRIREEIDYNIAKGQTPFRMGVHDGLRFAEDGVIALLRDQGLQVEARPTEFDA